MREINIGAQGFDEIRGNHNFYIDKTSFIREWWDDTSTVTLITRPRRFGKTLNMRMLESFFSNRYAGRGDLFEGLEIWKEKRFRELQGKFPVIFLSFADIKETTFSAARRSVIRTFQALFDQYRKVWEKDADRAGNRYVFMSLDPETPDADVTKSLQQFSSYLEQYYGQKVLILLDEYDTPLQEAFLNHYWKEMSDFMRSLFNSTFKTNPAMGRAVMTGITRVSKESIFSDLNNPNVVTTTSRQYETAFGFTEKEVKASLTEYGLSDQFADVKRWYDGFTFGDRKDIYNPWSILNYLKKREFAPYWANTSSNSLISYELRASDNSIKRQMEELMNGRSITTRIDEQIIFSQLEENAEAIWSLFLATGYLRVTDRTFDGRRYYYQLALTNLEVELMFEDMISSWFQPADSYSEFMKALVDGDLYRLNYYLNDILLNVASSFDTRKKVLPGHEPESFYHGLVLGLVVSETRYLVRSNRESGLGRYDVIMKPRPGEASLPAIIIEFKVFEPEREDSLEKTAERALRQIDEKQYDREFLQENFPKDRIIHYGMAFRGKEALVKKSPRGLIP